MPNYRYNTPEYMRRNNGCGCQQNAQPAQNRSQTAQVRSQMAAQAMGDSCCGDNMSGHDKLSGLPIAMAYVPWQKWGDLFEAEKGFHCGTIFEELYKPFRGIGGSC